MTTAACSFSLLEGVAFPVLLLDECSQMTEVASLLPMARCVGMGQASSPWLDVWGVWVGVVQASSWLGVWGVGQTSPWLGVCGGGEASSPWLGVGVGQASFPWLGVGGGASLLPMARCGGWGKPPPYG